MVLADYIGIFFYMRQYFWPHIYTVYHEKMSQNSHVSLSHFAIICQFSVQNATTNANATLNMYRTYILYNHINFLTYRQDSFFNDFNSRNHCRRKIYKLQITASAEPPSCYQQKKYSINFKLTKFKT